MKQIKKKIIEYDLNKEPFKYCTSFDKCQVNDCPLTRKPNLYKTLPEDKESYGYKKCRANKKVRMKIAEVFKLENKGLSVKELSNLRKSIQMKKLIEIHTGKLTENTQNTFN